MSTVGSGRSITIASSVAAIILISFRFALSTATANGTPFSQPTLFGAAFYLIREVGTCPHAAEGRFGHDPIHRLSGPVDPCGAVIGHRAHCLHRTKYTCLPPGLKPIIDIAAYFHTAGQRFPLYARA